MPLRSQKRSAALAALIAVAVGLSTFDSTSFASSPPVKASVATSHMLRWSIAPGDTWVQTLDPAVASDSMSIAAIGMVQANLVKLSYPSLKVTPDLATWTISRDRKTYTFHLRAAKFSNGDPVTATDAAWSITRALLPDTKSPVAMTYLHHIVGAAQVNSGKTQTLAGVKVLNRSTLRIRLDQPIAYFLKALSYPTADVLDKRVLAGKPAQSYLSSTCQANVGAGPFKFVCRSGSGQDSFYPSGHSPYMKFAPNPNYYGPKPAVTVFSPFFSTADAMYTAWKAGELDGTVVPNVDVGVAAKKPGFVKKPQLATDYLTPNLQMAPFNNLHCRLAVAYAIDRESITQKLFHGSAGALYDVVPRGMVGYFGKESDVPHFDLTRARKELAQCPGRLAGVTLPYQHSGSDADHEYDAIRANLAAVGADITLKPLSFDAWLGIVTQPLSATHTQIAATTWSADYPDSQDWVDNLLHSGSAFNISGFSNHRYDQLVDRGNVEGNTAKRAALYRQAQKIAVKDGAWIGIGYPYTPYIINRNVHGMVATPTGVWPLHNDWSKVRVS